FTTSSPSEIYTLSLHDALPIFVSRILPKRKLKRSIVNPCDALMSNTPIAKPDDSKTAIAASPDIFVLFLSFVIPRAVETDTAKAVQIGYMLRKNPRAIPPNATWERASPKREYLFSTKNRPIIEQVIATTIPVSKALCIKPYDKISRFIKSQIVFMHM